MNDAEYLVTLHIDDIPKHAQRVRYKVSKPLQDYLGLLEHVNV